MSFLVAKNYNVNPRKLPVSLLVSNVLWAVVLLGLIGVVIFYFPIQEKLTGQVEIFYEGIPMRIKSKENGVLNLFVDNKEKVDRSQLVGLHNWDITLDEYEGLNGLAMAYVNSGDKKSIDNLEALLGPFLQKNIPFLQGNIAAVASALGLYQNTNQYQAFAAYVDAQKNRITSLRNNKSINEGINQNRIQQNEIIQNHIKSDSVLLSEGIISIRQFELNKRNYMEELLRIEEGTLRNQDTDESIQGIEASIELEKYQMQLVNLELYKALIEALQEYKKVFFQISEEKKIESPTDGAIYYADVLNFSNNVEIGEEILIIRPVGQKARRMARIRTSNVNIGRIKKGDKVMISLDQYPIEKYGVIYADIYTKRSIPDKDEYIFGLKLHNGLVTSYNKKLQPQPQLKGSGQILLNRISIFELLRNEIKARREVFLARTKT